MTSAGAGGGAGLWKQYAITNEAKQSRFCSALRSLEAALRRPPFLGEGRADGRRAQQNETVYMLTGRLTESTGVTASPSRSLCTPAVTIHSPESTPAASTTPCSR